MSKELETCSRIKENIKIKNPLTLLQVVMYGNRNNGDVDQAYEELKSKIKDMKKLIELYKYLNENTNDYDLHHETVEEIEREIELLEDKEE